MCGSSPKHHEPLPYPVFSAGMIDAGNSIMTVSPSYPSWPQHQYYFNAHAKCGNHQQCCDGYWVYDPRWRSVPCSFWRSLADALRLGQVATMLTKTKLSKINAIHNPPYSHINITTYKITNHTHTHQNNWNTFKNHIIQQHYQQNWLDALPNVHPGAPGWSTRGCRWAASWWRSLWIQGKVMVVFVG